MLGRAHQRATITPKIDRKLIHDFCCIIILSSCSFCRTSYTLCHFWQTSALNECHSKHFHISMEMFLFCSIFHATRSKWYFCWKKKLCDCFSKDLNQLSHENTHFYWKSSKLFQIEKKTLGATIETLQCTIFFTSLRELKHEFESNCSRNLQIHWPI